MRVVDLIAKKRDGDELTAAEIQWLIQQYVEDNIPDYQMAAWAMAVFLRGMSLQETTDLTVAMARSGSMLDLRDVASVIVDKHSTGGVGDKTSLLLVPLVAAIGLPVAKMSGRGLGFSGGTIDKLESISGFRTDLTARQIREALRNVGLLITAQTQDLAPADRKLYELRDVTATVDSIPLIAASIMSKKIAAGTTHVALDVKYGSGAFMATQTEAQHLAHLMVNIGQNIGRQMTAIISSMEQPLGYAVGNALEVYEAIEALQEGSPPDLVELCMEVGAQLAVMAGRAPDLDAARDLLRRALVTGEAWTKFRQMVQQQGGDVSVLDAPEKLPRAPLVVPLKAMRSGYVTKIEARILGQALNELGGGRTRKGDTIDPAVGLVIRGKVGDMVTRDEPLIYIHARNEADVERAEEQLRAAYTIDASYVLPPPLVADVITSRGGLDANL